MNTMITVSVKEWIINNRRYEYLKDAEISAIPSKDDVLVLNINGEGIMFNVENTHFVDGGQTVVNVKRGKSVAEYEKPTPKAQMFNV